MPLAVNLISEKVGMVFADLGMRLNSKKFINAADMLFKGTLEESEAGLVKMQSDPLARGTGLTVVSNQAEPRENFSL